MSAARCAFDSCQAGGDILPGGHRVIGGGRNRATTWHPGCYEAVRRQSGGEVDVTATGDAPDGLAYFDESGQRWRCDRCEVVLDADGECQCAAPGEPCPPELVQVERCACVDGAGRRCLGPSGADGWCDLCRQHANPSPVEVFT